MTNSPRHPPTEDERKAPDLEAVLRVSEAIGSSLDLGRTLGATCEVAVDLLRVSHSSLVLTSPGRESGEVFAEYPEIGTRGLVIPFAGAPEREAVGASKEPIFIKDVSEGLEPGPLRDTLLAHSIVSILIVPVVSHETVLGYFSLDTVGFAREYSGEEKELCRIFASQAAVAIRNAQLHEKTVQQVRQLEALRRTTFAITSMQNDEGLYGEIVAQAVGLLQAKSGGIYEYQRERSRLTVIYDSQRKDRLNITLLVGQGAAGRLVKEDRPYIIINDYNNWEGRAPQYEETPPHGSVIEVPLKWRKQTIGVLYVEDEVGRLFTPDDALLLGMFADQAAVALNNTRLFAELKAQRLNLRSLSRAAAQALSSPSEFDHRRILQAIAQRALVFMRGDSATLWPYDKGMKRFVREELVSVGIPAEELEVFSLLEPDEGGITYRVMRDGWLPVPDVTAGLDFLSQSKRTGMLQRIGIKSFVGITLNVGDETVGVLYVNYNRPRSFDNEDRRRMSALAANAALALSIVRTAQLFKESEQKLSAQQTLTELARQLLGNVELQKMLDAAVWRARHALGTDRSSIVLPRGDGRLVVVAEDALDIIYTGEFVVERGALSQTGYTIDEGKPVRVYDYEEEEKKGKFVPSRFVREKGIRSGMSVPMLRGTEVVGAMLVHSLARRAFTQAEENLLLAIANQTAIAMKTAEQYEEIVRQSAYLRALHDASKEITKTGFDIQRVLDELVRQAVGCLVGGDGSAKATYGTIQTFDEETGYLEFVAAYPQKILDELKAAKIGHRRRVVNVPKKQMGLAGLTVERKEVLRVDDVTEGEAAEYYYPFRPETRSELTAPLLYGGKCLGVLNVESDHRAAFDEHDSDELKALADFAAVAIHNARQYAELSDTKRLVDARTNVAWLGMASSVWGHSVRGQAVNIRGLVKSLREELKGVFALPPRRRSVEHKLDRLDDLVTQILEKPLVQPLGSDEAVSTVPVNSLLRERVRQLQRREPYQSVPIRLDLDPDEGVTVRGDPQWLSRVFDILVDNSVRALSQVEPGRRLIAVSAEAAGDKVRITVSDTGHGIPPEQREKVLKERVGGENSQGGLGVGLLMARAIVQAFGGDITLAGTSPEGTTMVITLKAGRRWE